VLRIDPLGPGMSGRYQLLGLATLFGGHPAAALPLLGRADAQAGPPPGNVDSPTQMEGTRAFLIAATALAGNPAEAQRRYQAYRAIWPRRTVWRLTAIFLTRAQAGVPYFTDIANALVAAGMPRFADPSEDDKLAPTTSPLAGGEFTPTPMRVPGAVTIDTATLGRLRAAAQAPLILDVGRGMALPRGALLLADAPGGDDPL
ncbi:MAG TPA: hypothetical protein VMB71_02275, partial [Acetobacteraceae bacterium]|nr:hypothetical protein [Acetobacteraceae bacterium]